MKSHNVKTWPGPFQALKDGRKTFEFRLDDRNYQEGELIVHNEYDPLTNSYTGNALTTLIRYKLSGGQFGIPDGYCIMSVLLLPGMTGDSMYELMNRLPKNHGLTRMGVNWAVTDPNGREIFGTGWHEPLGALELFFQTNP